VTCIFNDYLYLRRNDPESGWKRVMVYIHTRTYTAVTRPASKHALCARIGIGVCIYYISIGWMSRVSPSDRIYPYVPRLYLISTIILYDGYSQFTRIWGGLHDGIRGRQNRNPCKRVAKRSAKTMGNKTFSTRYNNIKRKLHRNIIRIYTYL